MGPWNVLGFCFCFYLPGDSDGNPSTDTTLLVTIKEMKRAGLSWFLPPSLPPMEMLSKQKSGFPGLFPTPKIEKMENMKSRINQGQSPEEEYLQVSSYKGKSKWEFGCYKYKHFFLLWNFFFLVPPMACGRYQTRGWICPTAATQATAVRMPAP